MQFFISDGWIIIYKSFIIQSKATPETDRAGTIIILVEIGVQKGYRTSPRGVAIVQQR